MNIEVSLVFCQLPPIHREGQALPLPLATNNNKPTHIVNICHRYYWIAPPPTIVLPLASSPHTTESGSATWLNRWYLTNWRTSHARSPHASPSSATSHSSLVYTRASRVRPQKVECAQSVHFAFLVHEVQPRVP